MARDAAIEEMEESFAHLNNAMQGTTAQRVAQKVRCSARNFTVQQTWILAASHLHELLGQAIAYARSNNMVPVWSQ